MKVQMEVNGEQSSKIEKEIVDMKEKMKRDEENRKGSVNRDMA